MDSLIERLTNENYLWTVPGALRQEAAAEIARLRAANAKLLAALISITRSVDYADAVTTAYAALANAYAALANAYAALANEQDK